MQKLKDRQGQLVRVRVVEGKSKRIEIRVRKELQPHGIRAASFGLVFLG